MTKLLKIKRFLDYIRFTEDLITKKELEYENHLISDQTFFKFLSDIRIQINKKNLHFWNTI